MGRRTLPLVIVQPPDLHLRSNKPQRAPLWLLLPLRHWFYLITSGAVANRVRLGKIQGNCLAPFLKTGDFICVDPERSAVPGDLVEVAMRYQSAQRFTTFGAHSPPPIVRQSVKQLQRDAAGELHLCSAEGSVPARHHEIVGVVMFVQRRPSLTRWRCRTAPMREMNFRPAAAEVPRVTDL